MKYFLTFCFLRSLSLAQALDFTPLEVKEVSEGGTSTYVRFRDETRAVTFLPPRGWDYRGDAVSFCLTPKDLAGAEIDITVKVPELAIAPDAENSKVFEDLVKRSLPQGSSNIQVVAAAFNPLEIDGRKTCEVIVSYGFFGQTLKASYLYLSRDTPSVRFRAGPQRMATAPCVKSLLVFRVVARLSDFERLRSIFHHSLSSLAGL